MRRRGAMLVEFDLAGAEWVIVAYLADDANMLSVVKSGRSPHVATGALISRCPEALVIKEHELLGSMTDPDGLLTMRKRVLPELFEGDYFIPRSMTIRQAGKKSNHGLNYNMKYRRFALENEMPETDAKPIVELYNDEAYPGIPRTFHADVRSELKTNDRTIVNLLGRKARLLDQAGSDLWDKAYAFKPQSTVWDICRQAIVRAFNSTDPLFEPMQLNAQVHDSILFNYPSEPRERLMAFASRMVELMSVKLVAKGHEFVLGVDVKAGPNWGQMEKLVLPKDISEEWRPRDTAGVPLIGATI
jgi:hypothetical protein